MKATFPLGFPSGVGMVFYVDKITDLELVRGSCRCMIFVRPLSTEADIFPCKSASRSGRPLSSPRYLTLGACNFQRGEGSEDLCQKEEGVFFRVDTQKCPETEEGKLHCIFPVKFTMDVFLIHVFRNNGNFT